MSRVEDRLAIADLLTGWLHRDNGQWDELAALFHEDATISVTWFSGAARDFVAASRDHGAGSARNKHLIASPYVTFHGDRTLASLIGSRGATGYGASSSALRSTTLPRSRFPMALSTWTRRRSHVIRGSTPHSRTSSS